jgi:hypothetical protein
MISLLKGRHGEKEFSMRNLTKAILCIVLVLSGCATISKENNGGFAQITEVPRKDFTSLGLVFTENVIENNKGQIFTYYELIKQAKELGADAIINVTIDVKREGIKFMWLYLSPKETWYGSALAIKYTPGLLKDVRTDTTSFVDGTVVTTQTTSGETIIMTGGRSGIFGSSTNPASSGKKWYNPFTWFKK